MRRLIGTGALVAASLALGCGNDSPRSPIEPRGGASHSEAGAAGEIAERAPGGGGNAARSAAGGDGDGTEEPSGGQPGVLVDPCQGVTARGECVTPERARACVVPTGNGSPMLVTTDCRSFEHCDASSGQARCVLDDDACIPKQAECLNGKQLRTCDQNGEWQTASCSGACQTSAVGGFCVQGNPTKRFEAALQYEAVPVYDDYSDWADSSVFVAAEGVLVLSGDGNEWVDAALVDEQGRFSLQVPASSTGLEQLAFLLIHPDPTGAFAQVGVFDPDVPAGLVSVASALTGQAWSWTVALQNISSGDRLRIGEQQGSGAIHVYERLLEVQRYASEVYGQQPSRLAAWMHLNTAWDCGACFAPWHTEVAAMPFDAQLFVSATAQDRAYWSDAVTVHEAGHYVMWSYGVSPNEGGPHCLSEPTAPGQAWSEGWATGFSSILRGSPIYWDKQHGSMFWFDLERRRYDQGEWQQPTPSAGLLQPIDENEVAAMMWSLANDSYAGTEITLLGLRTANVTQPTFRRGYTRHVWDMHRCERTSSIDTGESAPMFADYLDGLACGGVSPAAIDRSTTPRRTYPYPANAPLCP
jgi:hypothetical protein